MPKVLKKKGCFEFGNLFRLPATTLFWLHSRDSHLKQSNRNILDYNKMTVDLLKNINFKNNYFLRFSKNPHILIQAPHNPQDLKNI
jgi:hypothetical protein